MRQIMEQHRFKEKEWKRRTKSDEELCRVISTMVVQEDCCHILVYSVFSSSKSPFETPLLPDLAFNTLWTSFEGIGDGFISVKEVSSLSKSSLVSPE